jgi:hypothetical protein
VDRQRALNQTQGLQVALALPLPHAGHPCTTCKGTAAARELQGHQCGGQSAHEAASASKGRSSGPHRQGECTAATPTARWYTIMTVRKHQV